MSFYVFGKFLYCLKKILILLELQVLITEIVVGRWTNENEGLGIHLEC